MLEAPINIEILHYNIKFYILLYYVDRGGSEWKMGGTRSEVWHFIFSLLWETVGTRAQTGHERYTYGHTWTRLGHWRQRYTRGASLNLLTTKNCISADTSFS